MSNQLLLIAGMHRSGTSMLARICNLLGAHMGPNILPPDSKDNPKGYWEDDTIVSQHNSMFARCSMDVNAVAPIPTEINALCDAEITALEHHLLLEYSTHSLGIIKDPRICRFIPQWKNIATKINSDLICLIPVRNPLEITASLKARDERAGDGKISVLARAEYTLLWWLVHVLEAEYHSRDIPRTFVRYEDILNDWRSVISDISSECKLTWPNNTEEVSVDIEAFISPTLHRQQSNLKALHDADTLGMASKAYDALLTLCNSHSGAEAHSAKQTLDTLRHQLETILPFFTACMIAEREAARHLELTREDSALERLNQNISFEISTLHHQLGAIQKTYAQDMQKNHDAITTLRKDMQQMEFEYTRLAQEYYDILHKVVKSYSWKVTAPLRYIMNRLVHVHYLARKYFNKCKVLLRPSVIKHCINILRKEGITGVRRRLRNYFSDPEKGWSEYGRWYAQYLRLTDTDRNTIKDRIDKLSYTPTISIIMPVYNPDRGFLVQAIESVTKQLYPHWELCIVDDASTEAHVRDTLERAASEDTRINVKWRKENGHISRATNDGLAMASGDYIAFLDHDDLLTEHALYCMVETVNQHSDAKLIYSDEDKINEDGAHIHAHFKPDWNAALFYSYNYLCHFVMVESAIAKSIQCKPEYNGCQDYDFLHQVITKITPEQIRHIPEVLYHWREYAGSTAQDISAKPYAIENSVAMLKEHTQAAGLHVESIAPHPTAMGAYRIAWALPEGNPCISLIIPTRNKHELVRSCIDSIRTHAGYEHYEIVIVNNQSDDPASLDYFDAISKENNIRVLHFDEPFNYAKMNNWAVEQIDSPYVGFINNDIVFTSEGWLKEMLSYFSLPATGAVGCKLLFPDGKLQHAGVCLRGGYNLEAVAGHYFSGWDGDSLGYMGRAVLAQELSAVTAAAMLVKTNIFREVGGFNAEKLAIAFNDIDLCLKITQHAKHKVIFTPYAEAIHLESASRGYEDTPEKMARFMRETSAMYSMWDDVLRYDPHYNPNLSTYGMDYSLAWPPERTRTWEEPADAKNNAKDKKPVLVKSDAA